MIQKLKSLFLKVSVLGLFMVPVAMPVVAHADIADKASCGANLNVDPDCKAVASADTTGGAAVNNIIKLVINIFSLVVGVVAVIMIIIGGLKYITSTGDSASVTSAKNTILYAVVGLVVVALAQFIVRFVLAKTGAATT